MKQSKNHIARIAELERQRDEAREAVVMAGLRDIIRRDNFFCYENKTYLPSESCRRIRSGEMTLEQAIADRNAKWPVFSYGEPAGLTLEAAYRMAV